MTDSLKGTLRQCGTQASRAKMKQRKAAPATHTGASEHVAKDEASRTLLGMISHELRTPIQSILANVEVMGLMALPAEAKQALQRLERSVEVALTRLDSISQFVVSAAGPTTDSAEVQTVHLPTLISMVVDELSAEAERNDQVISIELDDDVPRSLETESTRLRQILTNFMANAVRHGEEGHIVVRCARMAASTSNLPALEISVTNKTHRFPTEGDDKLWQPFVRTAPDKNRPKGMGLGLAVVKLLADTAGWAVGCDRPDDQTVRFFVRVPHDPSPIQPEL